MRISNHAYTSSNMTRFLARCNATYEGLEFLHKMAEVTDLDHAVHLTAINEETALVTGAHMSYRNAARGEMGRKDLESRISELLSAHVVDALRRYPVMWDDERQDVIPMSEDENGCSITATAVIDEDKRMIYVLETGWDYVYVVTVLDYGRYYSCGNYDGVVTMHRGTALLRIDEDGYIHLDEGNAWVTTETPEQETYRKAKAGKH